MLIEMAIRSDVWLTLLCVCPLIFGSIAGIFAASAQKRAAERAMQILNEAREAGTKEAKLLSEQFDPFIGDARTRLGTAFDLTQRLTGMAEAGAAEGLTAADRLAWEDADKLLNESLVATGNLRSGAASLGKAELGRRVLADASTRRLNYLQLAFSGATGMGNLAGTTGQLGLGGKGLATNLLQAVMGLAAPTASAAMAKGAAEAAKIQAFGGIGDALLQGAVGGFMGPSFGLGTPGSFSPTGAMAGMSGMNFPQLMILQNLFGQKKTQ